MKTPFNRRKKGSVLVIVLVTLVITSFALTAFLDKASTDLVVGSRDATAKRLRAEAYSALEVTLSVLSSFNQTVGSLHSPAEGWGDPLTFAEWTPTEGRTVDVAFEDESGKISLPNVDANTLMAVFQLWEIQQPDAQRLTDALLNWMKPNYAPTGTFTADYDQAAIPYAPPGRSLRSFDELAAIDVTREMFYDEHGHPNDLWHRFTDTFSLLNYQQPNINSARPDVLAAVGSFDPAQLQNLSDFANGTGNYEGKGPSYFRAARDASAVLGQGNVNVFGTQISALRIRVTVHEGQNVYSLNTIVTLTGQQAAQTVQSSATNTPSDASATTNPTRSTNAAQANNAPRTNNTGARGGRGGAATGGAAGAAANRAANGNTTATAAPALNYPFTVLDINENNDPVPKAPPPPPAE